MTAEIIQIRDYQSKKDIERMQRELEKEAAKILAETVPSVSWDPSATTWNIPYAGKGIDGMWPNFSAPRTDPA